MSKKISRDKSIRKAKNLTQLGICAVLAAVGLYYAKGVYDNFQPVPSLAGADNSISADVDIPDPNSSADPNKIIFTNVPVNTKDKFKGDLILVNNKYEYFSTDDEDLVSIMEMNEKKGITCFTSVDYSYTIIRSVYDAMADMICDFYDIYKNDTLIIYGSYRTHAQQEALYSDSQTFDDNGNPRVAQPGHSEHETGYAFDFSDTVYYDYEGDGDFKWLNDNCYKYGFVVRYTENKEKYTEIRSEPWHFRYVGLAHAHYMTKNNLCFEEYISLLSEKYSYDKEHLQITDDEGKNYEVYFVESDDGADTTNVPVPSGYKYDISGNNVDGFIVTVHKDEKVPVGQEHPTEAATTETATDTTTTTDSDEDEY